MLIGNNAEPEVRTPKQTVTMELKARFLRAFIILNFELPLR